jgi:hypothetical protein
LLLNNIKIDEIYNKIANTHQVKGEKCENLIVLRLNNDNNTNIAPNNIIVNTSNLKSEVAPGI